MSWKNGRYISGTRGVVFRLEQMQRQKRKRKAKASALVTNLSSQQDNDKYTPLFNKDGTFINPKYSDYNQPTSNKEFSIDELPGNPYGGVTIKPRYISFWLGVGILFFPFFFSWCTLRKGHSILAKVISLGWLFFVIVIPASKHDTSLTTSTSSQTATTAPQETWVISDGSIEVDAHSLYNEFMANPIKADGLYKGKLLKLTGTVDSIDREISGKPYATFSYGESKDIRLTFRRSEERKIVNLSKGQIIRVVGTCQGTLLSTTVSLNDCIVFTTAL